MNHWIVIVAIAICAGCAHTSPTSKAETDQLVEYILVGDSQRLTCAQDEISTCKATTRTPAAQAHKSCECQPIDAFDAEP